MSAYRRATFFSLLFAWQRMIGVMALTEPCSFGIANAQAAPDSPAVLVCPKDSNAERLREIDNIETEFAALNEENFSEKKYALIISKAKTLLDKYPACLSVFYTNFKIFDLYRLRVEANHQTYPDRQIINDDNSILQVVEPLIASIAAPEGVNTEINSLLTRDNHSLSKEILEKKRDYYRADLAWHTEALKRPQLQRGLTISGSLALSAGVGMLLGSVIPAAFDNTGAPCVAPGTWMPCVWEANKPSYITLGVVGAVLTLGGATMLTLGQTYYKKPQPNPHPSRQEKL